MSPTFFVPNFSLAQAPSIKAERKFYEAAADGKTAFIDARDSAAVAVKALTETGRAVREGSYRRMALDGVDQAAVALAAT